MLNRTVVSVVTQDDEEVEKPMAKTTNICVSSFARFLSHVSVVVVVVVVAGGGACVSCALFLVLAIRPRLREEFHDT